MAWPDQDEVEAKKAYPPRGLNPAFDAWWDGKHYGPGDHPSGSPQEAHGGDGAAEDAEEAALNARIAARHAKEDEAKVFVDEAIAEASMTWRDHPLSPAQQQEYREAAHKVIEYMPAGSLERFTATIQKVEVFPTLDALRTHYDRTGVGDSQGVAGFVRFTGERAIVAIDGGAEHASPRGIYAHEFAHVIDDHRSRSVSGTPEWYSAWTSNIGPARPLLSDYAATSPREGFAEYGRLVFTSPREARDMFPEAWAVWKKHGLL